MSTTKCLVLLTLFSTVSQAVDLTFLGIPNLGSLPTESIPKIIEIIRWKQPICVANGFYDLPLCNGNNGYPIVKTILFSKKIHQIVVADDELDLTSLEDNATDIINEIDVSKPSQEEIERNRPDGDDDQPGAIFVTKIQTSPITAVLVVRDCIPNIEVPFCKTEYEPIGEELSTIIPLGIEKSSKSLDIKYGLVSSFANHLGQILNIAAMKAAALNAKLQEKKALLNPAAEKKYDIFQGILDKKKNIYEGIKTTKQGVLQQVIQKKENAAQVIVDAAATKKAVLQSAIQAVIEKKQNLFSHQGILEKKYNVIQHFTNKKDSVTQGVTNAAATKHAILQTVLDKKKATFQSIIDLLKNKKQHLLDTKTVIINTDKKQLLQDTIDKLTKFELDLATKKQNAIQSLAEKKISAIKHISDTAQEWIGTASVVKPLLIGNIKQHFESKKEPQKPVENSIVVFKDDDEIRTTNAPEDFLIDQRMLEVTTAATTTTTTEKATTEVIVENQNPGGKYGLLQSIIDKKWEKLSGIFHKPASPEASNSGHLTNLMNTVFHHKLHGSPTTGSSTTKPVEFAVNATKTESPVGEIPLNSTTDSAIEDSSNNNNETLKTTDNTSEEDKRPANNSNSDSAKESPNSDNKEENRTGETSKSENTNQKETTDESSETQGTDRPVNNSDSNSQEESSKSENINDSESTSNKEVKNNEEEYSSTKDDNTDATTPIALEPIDIRLLSNSIDYSTTVLYETTTIVDRISEDDSTTTESSDYSTTTTELNKAEIVARNIKSGEYDIMMALE